MMPNGNLITWAFPHANVGTNPVSPLVVGQDGDYYGTMPFGGNTGSGTVFKMTPSGLITLLLNFASTNGSSPRASLVLGRDGNFYGTTNGGPTTTGLNSDGFGTVFKITASGVFETLHYFDKSSGVKSLSALVQGRDGDFYGTSRYGGSKDNGVVFKITPSGTLTTLVDFGKSPGSNPTSALLQVRDGNFYGTTESGGGNEGTIFNMMR